MIRSLIAFFLNKLNFFDILFFFSFKKVLFSLFFFYSFNSNGQNISRIANSVFPFSNVPDTVFVLYDNNFSDEQLLIIQTLQGILSKQKPKIFRDVGTGSSVWLSDLIEKEYIYPSYRFENDFLGLLCHFKENINGYVICDMHSTSSNIAISISGFLKTIPVTDEYVKLMDSLSLPMIYDLRQKDYNWVLENYYDSLNKNIVVLQETSKDLCLGDYSVFSNSFHFFDDIHSTLVDTFFSKMNNNSVLLGWGIDEFQTVNKSSRNSISVIPSDYSYNLSLLTNLDSEINQSYNSPQIDQRDSVHTVCFVFSDGDNIQWLLNWFVTDERWFGNKNRGLIDIGWTISPILSELAPTVMTKIYEMASNSDFGRDYFIAGPSGAGYIFPEAYKELDIYTSQLSNYMSKSDLNIVNIIGNEFDDFYLYSYLQKHNINALFYYDFSNYSRHNGKIKFVNDKPVISARYNLWGGFNSAKQLAKKLNNLPKDISSASGYSLIPVHNWSNSVDSILLCAELLNDDVRIVSPDKFVKLVVDNLVMKNSEVPHRIYPNPAENLLNLEIREPKENILKIEIFDNHARKLNNFDFDVQSKEADLSSFKIDISNLVNASYFIKLSLVGDRVLISSFIKK